jgi:hypothetical protein
VLRPEGATAELDELLAHARASPAPPARLSSTARRDRSWPRTRAYVILEGGRRRSENRLVTIAKDVGEHSCDRSRDRHMVSMNTLRALAEIDRQHRDHP